MATTIINLDEMIPEDRVVIYGGKEHKLEVSTTENYLKVLRHRKKLATIKDDDEVAQTEIAIEMLNLALPTIPKEKLLRLPLAAMLKLVEVVQGEMDSAEPAPEEGQPKLNGDASQIIDAEVVTGEST